MICVAMLLRIRWQRKFWIANYLACTDISTVLDSNYSYALMLLLKYPSPSHPYGPPTFVDDAIFLRDNFSAAGGAKIISKYSGKSPPLTGSSSRPLTPLGQALSPKQKFSRTRSPIPSPARFLQQQGGVEALFQGAAKNVLDRGERLGINQAVRDAMGEVRKNMQGLQISRSHSRNASEAGRWSLDEGRVVPASTVAAMNRRNEQLARMLGQAMTDLRTASISADNDKAVYVEAMDIAIAKIDFIKIYLEDATIPLSDDPSDVTATDSSLPPETKSHQSPSSEAHRPSSPQPSELSGQDDKAEKPSTLSILIPNNSSSPSSEHATSSDTSQAAPSSNHTKTESESKTTPVIRPALPVPTRSSIAQSSFSWMLEPDIPPSSAVKSSPPKSSSPFPKSHRRPTSGASREKAAFLFGEEGENPPMTNQPPLTAVDEGFNLGTLKRSKGK